MKHKQKISKKNIEQAKRQLGIFDRKSIEERGRQNRPVVFEDKRAKSRKEACKTQNVKKYINQNFDDDPR